MNQEAKKDQRDIEEEKDEVEMHIEEEQKMTIE